MKRHPIKALEAAIAAGFLSSRPKKLGIIVQNLPEDVREGLKDLTSDQARNVRLDWAERTP